MEKILFFICLSFILVCCSDNKTMEQYPVIDVVGSVEKHQRVYCSDYFSSMELIHLETRDECLLPNVPFPRVVYKDNYIFLSGECLYAFDSLGKFLNQIGKKGQGPGEYIYSNSFFVNTDKSIIYVDDLRKILEYDFNGNHISSIQKPELDNSILVDISYVGDYIFVGSAFNNGKNKYKYCLFNSNGEIVNRFPNYVFFNRNRESASTYDIALPPIRIDDQLYLKDDVNDTLYVLKNSILQPAYVFGLGEYSYPIEYLETHNIENPFPRNSFTFGPGLGIVGTPKFFFYKISVPDLFSKPKAKPKYIHLINEFRPDDATVYGIYNIEQNTNILLDTDEYLQKGIINDINGGLPIIPRYYAGDGVVVDVWNAEDMKEMLTDDYFTSQTIKDQQAHQKLKEILKNLKEDDNPIVVVAKLK